MTGKHRCHITTRVILRSLLVVPLESEIATGGPAMIGGNAMIGGTAIIGGTPEAGGTTAYRSQPSRHRYGHDACASNLREILEKSCPSDLFLLQICMVCCVHPREVVFCLFLLVACLHHVFHRECYLRGYPCIAYYIVVRQAQHGISASSRTQPQQFA